MRAAAARLRRRGAAEAERRAARQRILTVDHVPLLLLLRSALRCGGLPLRAAHAASRMHVLRSADAADAAGLGRRWAVVETYTCVMDMLRGFRGVGSFTG